MLKMNKAAIEISPAMPDEALQQLQHPPVPKMSWGEEPWLSSQMRDLRRNGDREFFIKGAELFIDEVGEELDKFMKSMAVMKHDRQLFAMRALDHLSLKECAQRLAVSKSTANDIQDRVWERMIFFLVFGK